MALVLPATGVIGLLIALPQQAPSAVTVSVLGGVWLILALAVTLPSRAQRAENDRSRSLARFRHAVNAIGDAPTRAQLEALLALARDLGLPEQDVAEDLARVQASLTALRLVDEMADGRLPILSTDPLTGVTCHLQTPVRFGRRRSDRIGDLLLTSEWLKFRGSTDFSVTWTEVSSVQRANADIIITLEDRRLVRFACQSIEHAARAGVIADYLRQNASVGYCVPGFSSAEMF